MSTGFRQVPPRQSALKWLILLVFAWSQLAFAVHRFDHQAADPGETCSVCLQFERDDEAPIDAGEFCPVPPTAIAAPIGADGASPTPGRSHYSARASP